MTWAEVVSPTACCRRARLTSAKKQKRRRQAPQFSSLRGENSQRGSHTGGPTILTTIGVHLLQGKQACPLGAVDTALSNCHARLIVFTSQ